MTAAPPKIARGCNPSQPSMAFCASLHTLQLLLPHDLRNSLPLSQSSPYLSSGLCVSRRGTYKAPARKHSAMVRASAQTADAAPAEADMKRGPASSAFPLLQLTFLEGNSWLWNVLGVQMLVDPVLVGNLDFGIPWLYDASKKTLKEFKLEDLPELDLLLITQNFDDHCHERTLRPLSKMFPDLQVISTPNAEPILSKLFSKVIYLEPGHSTLFRSNASEIVIRASAGPTLGPPWQRPENGYFVEVKEPKFSLYYEPHCVFNRSMMRHERADVVITPVVKQVLPLYTLVSGQRDAMDLVKLLQARFVVPLQNGDLDSKGFLSKLVSKVGTVEDFRELLQEDLSYVQVLEAKPGMPLDVPVAS
ncbi:hypothetical protein GOP47_0005935 [Adiantum capillus-veneris]|uniref:Metallo-beta-lactamase domain-containing protein n=1 Tax=Adiantum capillus-veneris TaxID=13818 RepID=A0A9D4ZJX5_ADICA|nr:hypothetical protein GOP47_0005935 [Adiantum capillus-veneris]